MRQSLSVVSPEHGLHRSTPRSYGHLAVCDGRRSRDFLVEPYARGAIRTLFQPIFRLVPDGPELFGVECLSRGPAGSVFESPASLFGFARDAGTVCTLDRACIALGLCHAIDLPSSTLVFLNLHPETLKNDIGFPAFLEEAAGWYGIALDRIVIELLEYSRIAWARPTRRCRQLAGLRAKGVRLALDDVHTSVDEVSRVADYQPDFLKIDGEVLRGAKFHAPHRHFLVTMLDFAERLDIGVIAEGLETEHDLRVTQAADISLAQGFLLARPAPLDELREFWLATPGSPS
ncbi:MAG TPA: EAL domain-containing protein [Gemmatimonadales bacterium]|nr:EAL domain-containing protein [Gemmatimonadales bacterium]